MIYCVIPRELEAELYPKMVEYYRDNPNVTVIVDRREGADRRSGRSSEGWESGSVSHVEEPLRLRFLDTSSVSSWPSAASRRSSSCTAASESGFASVRAF